MRAASILAVLAVACGGDDVTDADRSADADADEVTDEADTADDTPAPLTLTLSGTVSEIGIAGETPTSGVLIEAIPTTATTAVATATSVTGGTFSVTITSDGPFDGYFKATKGTEYLPTYLYPPAPLAANQSDTPVIVMTSGTFDALASFAQGGQQDGMGFIGIAVVDAALQPVAGAVITSSAGGTVRYNDANGTPSANATMTSADGRGYIFNVPAGNVTVGATRSGSTFASHAVQARADAVTLTIVTE